MSASPERPLGYVLATPARNEREALPALLASMQAQEVRPLLWLIVDDGSDDGSREWLEEARASCDFLELAPAPEAAEEYLGAHVARIKRWGLEQALARARARGLAPRYAGVLDADLELPPEHYRALSDALAENPELGVVSSLVLERDGDRVFVERFQRADLPRGATQFFRVECLEAMGGLPPWPSFDAIANVKARALGYQTRLLPWVQVTHRRATATRYGHAQGYARKGRYAWFLGLHPLLVLARGAAYAARRPHDAGYHFLRGYLRSALKREQRCPDPVVRRHYGLPRVWEVAKAALRLGPSYVSTTAQRPAASGVRAAKEAVR